MKIKTLLSFVLALAAECVVAAAPPTLVVDAVQMPAWIEQASGARDALVVGRVMRNKERVVTGAGARAWLRLADGSLVKLGENGQLGVDDLGQPKFNRKNVVTASLDLLSGPFRFTTQALSKFRGERDIKLRVVTITVGLRGTDVWARAEPARDLVCLIEGRLDVTRGDQAFSMAQPMSFYVAPKDKAGEPVGAVPKEQLEKWTQETELGAGALRHGGKWRLNLAELNDQASALKTYDQLRSAGYAAEIRPVTSDAGTIYRVRIANFATREAAAAFGEKLKGQPGIEPKVSK